MSRSLNKSLGLSALLGVALVLAATGATAPSARAESINYNVTLDTSDLGSRSTNGVQDQYRLDFFLFNNGTAGNNTGQVSNPNFGGGAGTLPSASFTDTTPVGPPSPAATGSLTDPGISLQYNLAFNYTPESAAGTSPDLFSFAIFDLANNRYLTTDATSTQGSPNDTGISFFTIDFTSGTPMVNTFASTNNGLSAPIVSVQPVPEPATWAMMAFGLGAIVWTMHRKKQPQMRRATASVIPQYIA